MTRILSMERDRQKRHLKKALRQSIRESILRLEPAARAAAEAELIARFPTLAGYASAHTVLLYANAFEEEIDTRSFFLLSLTAGKRVVCPRVERDENRMRLYQVSSPIADLEPGILGIPEPRKGCTPVAAEEVDWALVPGLAFDHRCFRLGRGAGHYDRLLPRLRADASCWALALDCQLTQELPVEPHDVPLDGVATPQRIINRS